MVESEIRKEEYTIPLREFFYKGTTRDVDWDRTFEGVEAGYYRTDGRDKCGVVA